MPEATQLVNGRAGLEAGAVCLQGLSLFNHDTLLPVALQSFGRTKGSPQPACCLRIKYLPIWNLLNVQKFHLTVE